MRVPPVSERMKEAPAHALRAVFAGIGQVLLVADRIKNRATDTNHAPSAAAPEPAAAAAPASTTATAPPAAAPASATPAATTAPPSATPATAASAAAPASATAASAATPATAAPAATAATATAASAVPAAGDLPVPHYDELSVASLRARMRGLDAAQLRILIDYESTHAERGTVLAMFERRLAKVEAGEA